MSRLYTRLRVVNINYGAVMNTYFYECASKVDKPSEKGINHIRNNSDGTNGKFTAYMVPLEVFEFSLIKLILYALSSIVKIVANLLLAKAKDARKITPGMCKFINFQQKLHFIFFNTIMLDLMFYGLRTISHTSLGILEQLITMICVGFVVYDAAEIWHLSSLMKINQDPEDLDSEELTNEQDSMIKLRQEASTGDSSGSEGNNQKPEDGGKKELHHVRMINKLVENQTIQNFCTNDLRKKTEFSKNTMVLVSNYTFLLRLVAVHVLLVGLTQMPQFQLILLMSVEILYASSSIKKYAKKKHLRSLRFLLPKVGQSLFLFTFEVVTFFTNWGLEYRTMPLPVATQKFLINLLFFATIFEYVVLAINLGFLIKDLIVNRKKKKPKFLEYKKAKPLNGSVSDLKVGQMAMIGGVGAVAALEAKGPTNMNQVHPIGASPNKLEFRDLSSSIKKKRKRRKKAKKSGIKGENGEVRKTKKRRTRKVKKTNKMRILKKNNVR